MCRSMRLDEDSSKKVLLIDSEETSPVAVSKFITTKTNE